MKGMKGRSKFPSNNIWKKKEWHCLAINCFVSQEEEEDSRLVSLKYIRLQKKKTMEIGKTEIVIKYKTDGHYSVCI
jgi:hypothetical protein